MLNFMDVYVFLAVLIILFDSILSVLFVLTEIDVKLRLLLRTYLCIRQSLISHLLHAIHLLSAEWRL